MPVTEPVDLDPSAPAPLFTPEEANALLPTVEAVLRRMDLKLARLRELETDIRAREGKLIALRDYALGMQRSFFRTVKGGSDVPATGGPTP